MDDTYPPSQPPEHFGDAPAEEPELNERGDPVGTQYSRDRCEECGRPYPGKEGIWLSDEGLCPDCKARADAIERRRR